MAKNNQLTTILYKELDPAFARRAKILIEQLGLKGNEHILEVGCGRGFYEAALHELYPKLRITAIDRNDTYLSVARKTVQSDSINFENQNALDLPYKRNSFDAIFSTEVLEHLPDDLLALQEMYRVVRPGGIVMITVPRSHYPLLWDPLNYLLERLCKTHVPKDIWWLAGIWADHERLYSEEQLVSVVKKAGFQVEKVWRTTRYCIPFAHFLLYGIGKNIVEKGLLPSFNRFSVKKKPSLLLHLIRSIVYFFDAQNKDTQEKNEPTVNLVIKLRKIASEK